MDNQYGTGSGMPFEYVVAEKKTGAVKMKRIALILVYIFWAVAVLIGGVTLRLIVPLIGFLPLTLWIMVFLTWRITQVEYEYSFFSGVLTIAKLLGGRSRKTLVRVTIREMGAILPAEDPYTERINAYAAEKEIWAASHADAEGLYAAMWKTENGVKHILWFEPNERAVKILQYYNRSAVTVKKQGGQL